MKENITNPIAERVKFYRNFLRLPQSFVSDTLQIDRSTYSRMEMGKIELSASALRVLANLFRVSVETFFEPLRIDLLEFKPLTDTAQFRFTDDFRAPNPEGIHAVGQATKDLFIWANEEKNSSELKNRQKRSTETYGKFEIVNEAIEACLPLTQKYMIGDSLDIYRFIREKFGPWISWNAFGTFSGIYLKQNFELTSKSDLPIPLIGIHSEHPSERQRFSAAHELGHHLFGKNEKIGSPTKTVSDPEEKEANQFAADLLMNKSRVLEIIAELKASLGSKLELQQLVHLTAGRLQVSFPAMINRLTNIGAIPYDQREPLLKANLLDTGKKILKDPKDQEIVKESITEAEKDLIKTSFYKTDEKTGGPKTPNDLRFLQDYSYINYIENCKTKQPFDSNQIFQYVVKYVSENHPRYKVA
jgi:Zn-dependent peptidase ImmA (M78 family)/transcriptional regulator with XRE-family HTH domain